VAYTNVDAVLAIPGSGNATGITAANIWKWINRGDGLIDDKTGTTWSSSYQASAEDSDVDKTIEGISAKFAVSFMYRNMASQALVGVKFTTGPVDKDNKTRQQEFLALSKAFYEEAFNDLVQSKKIQGLFAVHRTI
jgi:hypothetical protein